ncbi:MAG: type II toxin-antitoxin system HicA family toxin, partial [Planctomycetota bacterium]
DELKRLLAGFGYGPAGKGKTSGSRVRFTRQDYPPINLHKPHRGNMVRRYQLRQVDEFLMSEGWLGDDDESNEI